MLVLYSICSVLTIYIRYIYICQKWHFKVLFVLKYIFHTQSIFMFTFLNHKSFILHINKKKCNFFFLNDLKALDE